MLRMMRWLLSLPNRDYTVTYFVHLPAPRLADPEAARNVAAMRSPTDYVEFYDKVTIAAWNAGAAQVKAQRMLNVQYREQQHPDNVVLVVKVVPAVSSER